MPDAKTDRQLGLNRVVALKMILAGGHAGADALARFKTEAEAVARLQHPHIVQIHEVGEQDGLPFFSVEFCDGGSLADKLRTGPLLPQAAARLVEQLARAVHVAHQAGIVHRDLKPANILLAAGGTPKVTDFGLAKRLGSATGNTQTGAVLGTPSYMAPEQAGGKAKEVGPAADVYALGAILYECLTGRPPFLAPTAVDTILQVVSEPPLAPRALQPPASSRPAQMRASRGRIVSSGQESTRQVIAGLRILEAGLGSHKPIGPVHWAVRTACNPSGAAADCPTPRYATSPGAVGGLGPPGRPAADGGPLARAPLLELRHHARQPLAHGKLLQSGAAPVIRRGPPRMDPINHHTRCARLG